MLTRTFGAVVRELRGLAETHHAQALSDDQLLARFASQHEEAAFAALMHRHGRLVWCVCRNLLGHHQDAEDAYQATFLILALNADRIRNQSALPAWLHGTAYRIALRARRDAARRRRWETACPPAGPPPAAEPSLRE